MRTVLSKCTQKVYIPLPGLPHAYPCFHDPTSFLEGKKNGARRPRRYRLTACYRLEVDDCAQRVCLRRLSSAHGWSRLARTVSAIAARGIVARAGAIGALGIVKIDLGC